MATQITDTILFLTSDDLSNAGKDTPINDLQSCHLKKESKDKIHLASVVIINVNGQRRLLKSKY
jgi:hypothetical protein